MKAYILLLTAVFAALAAPAMAAKLDRCSLAKAMYKLGVPKNELARWTCIADHESKYDTGVVGKKNKNGTFDYGIFQINNRWWCQDANGRKSSNGCKISCNDLLKDDITASVTCARRVLKEQGWGAWSTLKYCNGKLESIDSCF